jgi:hypothetical protein
MHVTREIVAGVQITKARLALERALAEVTKLEGETTDHQQPSLGLFLLTFPIVEGRETGWHGWSFAMLATLVPLLVGQGAAYKLRVGAL